MSDHAPTTDEVRASWFSKESGLAVSAMSTISSGEYTGFDRWLEQVKAEAWAEGYSYCFDMERRGIDNVSLRDNPYRKGETE